MPNNCSLAEQQLKSLLEKFHKNPKVIEKGYMELVPPEQATTENGKAWYLPHHGYITQESTAYSQLKVICDCSASFQGVSLNSQLSNNRAVLTPILETERAK